LEKRIPDVENAGAEAISCRAKPEISVHLQRRERDVRAIELVQNEEDEQKGEKSETHPPDRGLFEITADTELTSADVGRTVARLRLGVDVAQVCSRVGGQQGGWGPGSPNLPMST